MSANSVTIDFPLSGETVQPGFTATGTYTSVDAMASITATFGGVSPPPFMISAAGVDQPWSITFAPNNPTAPGNGDLSVTITGASGASGDQSDDIVVTAAPPPLTIDIMNSQNRPFLDVATGFATVQGTVHAANGTGIICLLQQLNPHSKQTRTISAAVATVGGTTWLARINVLAVPPGKRRILRAILLAKDGTVLGITTAALK